MIVDNSIELFSGINKVDVGRLLKCMGSRSRNYKKGDFIFLAGQSAPAVSILLSGRAQVVRENAWGDSTLIKSLTEGEIFGEVFACMGLKVIPVSVIAVENSVVLMININSIIHTCENACSFHMQFISNLLKIIANKNAALNQKMSYMTHKTIRGRITAYFNDQITQHDSFEFTIPFNRTELAAYLCVDRSAMSRELSNMKQEGIIDFGGKKICWLKKDYLH
jgi:CRP-like cAMP-binding protein